MLNLWLHVVSLIVFTGAVVGLWLVFLPALAAVAGHEQRSGLLARGLKFYNPLQIGALGILLFTGAFQLTELKAVYREQFLQQLGHGLAIKLSFAFLLVIFSVYQSMGIGHRFVRRQESGGEVTPEELCSIVTRLKACGACMAVLTAVTMWLGLRLR